MNDITIGIAGAAGDGMDKTGDSLAKTASRLGLYVCAYNSYQSIIRGGHIWLRIRLGQEKVYTHGDRLHALIALNQDSIERHAPEIESGGVLLFNGDKLRCNIPLRDNVASLPLPIAELTNPLAPIPPGFQTTAPLARLPFCLSWTSAVLRAVRPTPLAISSKPDSVHKVNLPAPGSDTPR